MWLATCKPLGEKIALKILELDNMAVDLVSGLLKTLILASPQVPSL